MRIVVLLSALLLPAATAPTVKTLPPGTIKPICRNPTTQRVEGPGKANVHPLTAEPPAKEIKAVVRTVDGCNKPIVVSEKVGAPKR